MTELLLKYASVISVIVGVLSVLVSIYGRLLYKKVTVKKQLTAKKYSVMLNDLTKMFSEIDYERVKNSPQTIEEVLEFLQILTDKYKLAFDDITESNCRITIKILSYENSDVVIRTLVRDSFSESHGKIFDKSFKSRLTDDTAALSIFSGNKYFLENDLTKMKSYSSADILNLQKHRRELMLSYSSILVVPFSYGSESQRESLLGFLTINSSKRMAFDKSVDIDIARGLADAMTPIIIQMQKFVSSNYN
jgi:hypothetical protein